MDVVLPTKHKKVQSAIEEWHKFKQHKIQKGDKAASFLKTERGILDFIDLLLLLFNWFNKIQYPSFVFDSKFYNYKSLKAVGLLNLNLNFFDLMMLLVSMLL